MKHITRITEIHQQSESLLLCSFPNEFIKDNKNPACPTADKQLKNHKKKMIIRLEESDPFHESRYRKSSASGYCIKIQ